MNKINFYICPFFDQNEADKIQLKQDDRINYIDWRHEKCDFYTGWDIGRYTNQHHWKTKSAFIFLKRIAQNEGFELYENFNIKTVNCGLHNVEIYQPLNQTFKVHNYVQNYDAVGDFNILEVNQKQLDLLHTDCDFLTQYHTAFYGPHHITETINLNAPNDKSIFIFADSMVIPIASLLCASFKRCVIFDNRVINYNNFDLTEFDHIIGINYLYQEIFNNHMSLLDFNYHSEKSKKIDICTINCNNNLFSNLLILSILTHIKSFNYRIVLFDNSDKEKFDLFVDTRKLLKEKNIEFLYVNNTKKNIINFEKDVLEANKNICESPDCLETAKYSYTVDWFIKNFENDFILLDQNAVLIKDLDFVDSNLITISDIESLDDTGITRFIPDIQYFNVEKIRNLGIKYFDPMKINQHIGSSFHDDLITKTREYKIINQNDYIRMHTSFKI